MCMGNAYSEPAGAGANTLFVRVDSVTMEGGALISLTDVVRNLSYAAADNSLSDCELYFNGVWHPFTASPNDTVWWGKDIYNAAVAGELGDVAPYTAPE